MTPEQQRPTIIRPAVTTIRPPTVDPHARPLPDFDAPIFFHSAVRRRALSSGLRKQREKEAEMHALVVRVTIHNADRTREVLNSQVVPQVSGAPGFKTGYWTWSSGGGELNGLSMIIFDSEEDARAAGDRISAIAADAPDDVTLDGVEVREVVASA
jgi:hypothetical protein